MSLLETGLAAIKQGQYAQAIALLDQYLSEAPSDPVKAKMGLVVAYSKSDRTEDAIALCQDLQQHPKPKVQDWATRMLEDLDRQTETGFVPLEVPQSSKRRTVFMPKQKESAEPETFSASPPDLETQSPPLVGDLGSFSPEVVTPAVPHSWSDAPRATRWQPLKPLNPARLQWAGMGAIALLIFLIHFLWRTLHGIPIWWLDFTIEYLGNRGYVGTPSAPLEIIIPGLIALWFVSPWILDFILQRVYGMRSLPSATLARYSPETHRTLNRFCQQTKISTPQLRVLPTETPILFTYGSLRRFSRIIASQGLLDQLKDDEIAALYAREMGYLQGWDFSLMSLIALVLQIPYTFYGLAAIASDFLRKRAEIGKKENVYIATLIRIGAELVNLVAATSYGLFCYLRWAGLWLSRQRVIYRDRDSCNLTGNPNALTRALLKIAISTSKTIQIQRKTDYLLESFELLAPISYRSTLHWASRTEQTSLQSLLIWEQVNSKRIEIAASHPLTSHRLEQLIQIAQSWQITPELTLDPTSQRAKPSNLQSAPAIGAALGFSLALVGWIVAQVAFRFGTLKLNWLAIDHKLFTSFTLIGFGLGAIARFNQLFPDLEKQPSQDLTPLLLQPSILPLDSPGVRVEGKLLGRSQSSNSLLQDLILETDTGLIQLSYCSQLGAIGNLMPQSTHPRNLIGHSVTITGWFRRTGTPYIEIDLMRSQTGRTTRGGNQVWSILIALIALSIGLISIL